MRHEHQPEPVPAHNSSIIDFTQAKQERIIAEAQAAEGHSFSVAAAMGTEEYANLSLEELQARARKRVQEKLGPQAVWDGRDKNGDIQIT